MLELILILAIAGIIVWIALPTIQPTDEEALISFAKDQLSYLHQQEQAYFRLHGKYVPFPMIAEDSSLGSTFDSRFAEERPLVNEVRFVGPTQEAFVYQIVAILPNDDRYEVNQSGIVTRVER